MLTVEEACLREEMIIADGKVIDRGILRQEFIESTHYKKLIATASSLSKREQEEMIKGDKKDESIKRDNNYIVLNEPLRMGGIKKFSLNVFYCARNTTV